MRGPPPGQTAHKAPFRASNNDPPTPETIPARSKRTETTVGQRSSKHSVGPSVSSQPGTAEPYLQTVRSITASLMLTFSSTFRRALEGVAFGSNMGVGLMDCGLGLSV